jgi:hypothetical protein
MQLEQLYLINTIVLAGQQPNIIRLNDSSHVKSMRLLSDIGVVEIVDKMNKLHLIPLTQVKQMVPLTKEKGVKE